MSIQYFSISVLYSSLDYRFNPKASTGAQVILNSGLKLREGDGAYATAPANEVLQIENNGDRDVEFLLFDLE